MRINSSLCLDRCELGPTMVIHPEGVWYNVTTREEVDEILTRHLVEGGRVERLMLHPEDKPRPSAEGKATPVLPPKTTLPPSPRSRAGHGRRKAPIAVVRVSGPAAAMP